jgi:two-component system, sensor histidine kinase and response regulator
MATTLKVLCADDEEGMRLGIQRILATHHLNLPEIEGEVEFSVEIAADGEECIAMLGQASYDILLLDHKMPGLTGLDVLHWLDEQTPAGVARREQVLHATPLVIMVTAYASLETAVEAMKRGAFDFLAKPFTPAELRSVVAKAAGHLLVIRRAQELAREKRRVRFEFISVLSHELKAPLNAVEGYLRMLQEGVVAPGSEQFGRTLERCQVRLQGMRNLIYDMLDVTRIESGEKARNLEQVSLPELVRTAVETATPEAVKQAVAFKLELPEQLDLTADRSEIEIILNNLISNAVKYNKPGGEVRVTVREDGSELLLEVADTGIGLTPDEQSHLFKEFYRAKNEHTKNILGTGLGLSTVKRLVGLYLGQISLQSERGVGTAFTIRIPLQQEAVATQ